ncbi:MAG: hypothetical protein GAK39_02516 [Variovorax sp.]|nr:MAG: hypothetical protein GAK39_02516 [Variovorax sp.]
MGWGGTFLSPWLWSWRTRCFPSSRGLRWWLPCGGGGWLLRLLWKGWSWIWMRLGSMLRWVGCLMLPLRMLRLLRVRWLCLWKGPLCGLGILLLKAGCGWFAWGCLWICSSRRCFLGEGSELCLPLIVFLRVSAGNSPRRASHFLLLRQKKVTKEKATPLSVSLRFATGNLRCSATAGGPQNSLHCVPLRQLRPLSRLRLRSSAQPEGSGSGHRCARPPKPFGPSLRSAAASAAASAIGRNGRARPPHTRTRHGALTLIPSGCAAKREHRRLPVAKRRVADSGVAFLCLLSLARQRK